MGALHMEPQSDLSPATEKLLGSAEFQLDDWPVFLASCERAVELFGRMFGKLVGVDIAMEVVEIVNGPASEMVDALRPGMRMLVPAQEWDHSIMLYTTRQSAFVAADRLLGGGGSIDAYDATTQCTNFEISCAGLMLRFFAAAVESSLTSVANPGLVPGPCEEPITLERFCGASAPAIAVRCKSSAPECKIELTMVLLQSVLAAVGEPFRGSEQEASNDLDPKWQKHIEQQLRQADVNLTAILDGGVLTLDRLARFQVGQLLELPSGPGSLVNVVCNGQSLLRCRLGQSDGAFVLRVERNTNEEQEFVDELLAAEGLGRRTDFQ